MYKPDLALNNLQGLICHKVKPNKITLPIMSCTTIFKGITTLWESLVLLIALARN